MSKAVRNARLAKDPHSSHINHNDQNVGAGELEAAGNLSRFPMVSGWARDRRFRRRL